MNQIKYYTKQIYGLWLNTILFLSSWVIPKKKGSILLGAGFGEHFSGNPRYFCLYLHHLNSENKNPFSEYFWITKNPLILNKLQQENIPVVDGWSLKGFWKILRAEYLIMESAPASKKTGHDIAYQRLFMGYFRIVQTWHGSPVKRILLDALKDRKLTHWYEKLYYRLERLELKNIWCIVTMGEREKKILTGAFNNQNVYILGYPKNDLLIDSLNTPVVDSRLKSYDRIILYAPTFRENTNINMAFSDTFLMKLSNEMKKRNWVFLVKKHPFDQILTIPSNLDNVQDVTSLYDDIQILLSQTDLLISDYSSIYVDFLLTRKPILFYVYDLNMYKKQSRNFYYDFLTNAPGEVITNEEDLLSQIVYQELSPNIKQNYTKSIEIFHNYTDANSSKRLADFLIEHRYKV